MSPSIPPYDPGTIEAPGLPKVEVFFDPPVKIPEEQDPKVLAQVAQVAQLAGALASLFKDSCPSSPSVLKSGDEDKAGTVLSSVEVRVDGGAIFMTPHVHVPVVGAESPHRYQLSSYCDLPSEGDRLLVPENQRSDALLRFLVDRANENPNVRALLASRQ